MTRILLIEDNQANLDLMNYLLGAFGYQPRTAMDGGAGFEAARGEVFDLIICDVHLPVMDGYEVARRLKADPARRTVPLVAVTALAMVGDREKVLTSGFDGYIAKPIDPETFVRQVETFLRHEKRKSVVPQPSSTVSASPHGPVTRHTILVVDNLPLNLDLKRSILEPQGYRVLTAEGVQEGLAMALENRCDLILSDVCMFGGTGFDFIQLVKADPRISSIPFVFITSTMMDERDQVRGLALGAVRYLLRPIEPEVLLKEIQDCLDEAGRSAGGENPDRR